MIWNGISKLLRIVNKILKQKLYYIPVSYNLEPNGNS